MFGSLDPLTAACLFRHASARRGFHSGLAFGAGLSSVVCAVAFMPLMFAPTVDAVDYLFGIGAGLWLLGCVFAIAFVGRVLLRSVKDALTCSKECP